MKKMILIGSFLAAFCFNAYAENNKIQQVVIKNDIFEVIPRGKSSVVATELGNGVWKYNQTLDDKTLNTMMTNINKTAKAPLSVCVFENHVLVLTKMTTDCESVNEIEDFTVLDMDNESI